MNLKLLRKNHFDHEGERELFYRTDFCVENFNGKKTSHSKLCKENFTAILIAEKKVFSQQYETDQQTRDRCEYLQTVRTNFSACCEFPKLVIQEWDYKVCYDKCSAIGKLYDTCCVYTCCLELLGVINYTAVIDETTNEIVKKNIDVDWQGLVYSFLLSVENNTQWLPVVTQSTYECYVQFGGSDEGIDCDFIPKSLESVINCANKFNYIRCPPWNPFRIPECKYTMEFAQHCDANIIAY